MNTSPSLGGYWRHSFTSFKRKFLHFTIINKIIRMLNFSSFRSNFTQSWCVTKQQLFYMWRLEVPHVKKDRFTACFKTCGTGPLILGVRLKSTLVPRLFRQSDRQTNRQTYHDNLFVKRSIPTVYFAHTWNPIVILWPEYRTVSLLFKPCLEKQIFSLLFKPWRE